MTWGNPFAALLTSLFFIGLAGSVLAVVLFIADLLKVPLTQTAETSRSETVD